MAHLRRARAPGNAKALCAPWKPPKDDEEKDTDAAVQEEDDDNESPGTVNFKKVFIVHEEESLKKRRKKARGTCSIQQVENMHLVTASSLSLPERPRQHYAGSNLGNVISPVVLRTSPWTATVKHKKDIYTKRFRIPVGGQNPNGEKAARPVERLLF